jgi:hypothetical protein
VYGAWRGGDLGQCGMTARAPAWLLRIASGLGTWKGDEGDG